MMIYTEAFCTACICNVALGDTSPQAKRFVDASRHSKMNKILIGEDGRCFHCGKSGLVVHCMTPEPTIDGTFHDRVLDYVSDR